MKKQLSFGVVSLFFALTTSSSATLSGGQERDKSAGIPEQFIGAWRLVALEVVEHGREGPAR